MPLQLIPVPQPEWLVYFSISGDAFKNSLHSMMYPSGFSDEAKEFNIKGIQLTADRYPGRTFFFKVVDSDLPGDDPLNGVVGVSSWRIYKYDRSNEQMAREAAEAKRQDEERGSAPGLVVAVRKDFNTAVETARKKHVGGQAHVLLQGLATRTGFERRGVGALNVRWGLERADELDLPCYLEATTAGRGLYKKMGFVDVEPLIMTSTNYDYSPWEHWFMKRPAKSERL